MRTPLSNYRFIETVKLMLADIMKAEKLNETQAAAKAIAAYHARLKRR